MMRTSTIASLPLAMCLAGTAIAGPPQGGYTLDVGGANEVWYPDGDDRFCDTENDDEICFVTTGVATDGTGGVTGTGRFQIHFQGEIDADLPMTLVGKLGGTTGKPKPKVTVDAAGISVFHFPDLGMPNVDVPMTLAAKFTCANPLPHSSKFSCKGRGKICATAFGRRKCFGGGGLLMTHTAGGGSWHLAMDLATSKTGEVSGELTATLANGATEGFYVVKGKYNPKKDSSSLKILSTEPLSKNKIAFTNLVVGPGTVTSGKMTFTIAGEKGKEVIVPAP